MFKFIDRDKALEIINKWLAEGSKLESWGTQGNAEWVVLRGKDGAREEFYIFYTWKEFYEAVDYEPWL